MGDNYISHRGAKRILNYPYLYVSDLYGIRLHKIRNEGDNTWIELLDRLPGESEEGRMLSLDSLIVWTGNRVYIAQRSGERIIKLFEGNFPDLNHSAWMYGISDDSLLLNQSGIVDIGDPENPVVLTSELYVSFVSITLEDRLFYIWGNQLRIYDLSDPENPTFVDSTIIEFGRNDGVSPKRVGNTLAFHHRNGVLFAFLDDDLNVSDTYNWSINYTTIGLQVIQDSLFLAVRFADNNDPLPGIICEIFDPDGYPDEFNITSFYLPELNGENWQPYPYLEGDFCTADDSLFYALGQLWNLADFDNPELIFETPTLTPPSVEAFWPWIHLGFSDGKAIIRPGSMNLLIVDLLSGDTPDTIAYIDSLDSRMADIQGSIIVDFVHDIGIIVFRINNDRSVEELYTITQDFRNVRLNYIDANYYAVFISDYSLNLYRLGETREYWIETMETDERIRSFEWNNAGLFFCTSGILWWLEVEDEEFVVIDTAHFEIGSNGRVQANRDWIAYGPNLWSIEDGEITYAHTFEWNQYRIPDAVALYQNRIAHGSSVTTVIDLSDESYTDTLALFLDSGGMIGRTNSYMHGDFIWSWSRHALMKFYITGEYDGVSHNIETTITPATFTLGSAYPNPFNPSVTIPFYVPAPSEVTLNVYNITGQLVTTLFNGRIPPGHHQASWHSTNFTGSPAASGLYFIMMQTPDYSTTRKIILLK